MTEAELQAGPELDAVVAERVMGWRRRGGYLLPPELAGRTVDAHQIPDVPAYSTDIKAAWDVFLALSPPADEITVPPGTRYTRAVNQKPDGVWAAGWQFVQEDRVRWYGRSLGSGATAPVAICRAGLEQAERIRLAALAQTTVASGTPCSLSS